jgi:hypothetical protein
MDPKIWGKAGWTFLFSVALDFPERPDFQEIHNYKRFFTYLQYVLPCEVCRLHYASHLREITIDPYLTSRDNLFLWILKMHNLVNKQIGKSPIARSDVMRLYFNNQINVIDCRMDPQIWGKAGWKFLFAVAYEYPKSPTYQDIDNYKRFFTYLQYVLPCKSYRTQYYNQLVKLPIDPYLTTSVYLFKWVLKMHNMVNNEIGRPLIAHEDVLRVYFQNQIAIGNEHPLTLYDKEQTHQSPFVENPPYGTDLIERSQGGVHSTIPPQPTLFGGSSSQYIPPLTDSLSDVKIPTWSLSTKNPDVSDLVPQLPIIEELKDPNLLNKNISLAILIGLASLMIWGPSG